MAEERNMRVTRTGKVVSDKMQKTVVVAIERLVQHPSIKRRNAYHQIEGS